MIKTLFLVAILLMPVQAKIQERLVEYQLGDVTMQGFMAWDDSHKNKRSGVLIVHEWMGLSEYVKRRARQMASLGFVAFAPDIYGKGVRPSTPEEAGKTSGYYKSNPLILRDRTIAGLKQLISHPLVDEKSIAAIGYCFGGTAVLELARSGANVKAIVSFHGGLKAPLPAKPDTIQGEILVLHGGIDPHVPDPEVTGFFEEMRNAKAKWQFVAYGSAVHSFTNKGAGSDITKGAAYDAVADKRSFHDMLRFFRDVL
ncbi:MAG: dienelactone hydrolase family protein [Candidatus Cloacimonetes bacterium]|nr:dienelactone hydrolase family protein [Candidatus Cloacimonadota bacterium]